MIKVTIVVFTLIAVAYCLEVEEITGTTPPAVPCPNSLCKGKSDGNYEYYYYSQYKANYFLQCSNGLAYCQGCFPLTLEFSKGCNQCLYTRYDDCVTTQQWKPATTLKCPDECPNKGPEFNGNILDPHSPNQYVACWRGTTVGCIACPPGLEFNEKWNACLYDGIYKTQPLSQ